MSTRNVTSPIWKRPATGRRLVIACAAALTVAAGAACSSTTDATTSTTAGTARPAVTTGPASTAAGPGTTRGTTAGSTSGSVPTVDEAVASLPISATQKSCLTDKINSDPTLKTLVSTKSQYTKAEGTQFVNLMLSCMTRADLVNVIVSALPNPDSPESKCQAAKISELNEEQLAGFLAQDPETIKQLAPAAAQCAALGTSSTTR